MNHPRRPDIDRRTVLKLAPLALAGDLDLLTGRAVADAPPPAVEPKLDPMQTTASGSPMSIPP